MCSTSSDLRGGQPYCLQYSNDLIMPAELPLFTSKDLPHNVYHELIV